MGQMTASQRRAFLLAGTRTAKVASTRKDGRPHVVPVWFLLDGDDLLFVTSGSSVKGHTIRREGRAAVCVDDDRRPYAFAMLDARASTSHDHDEVPGWSIRIAERYMGRELANEYGELKAGEGMMLVRVTPETAITEISVTGE